MTNKNIKLFSCVWAFLAALLLTDVAAAAQTDKQELIERGKREFIIYCSSCHGVDGMGKGPMVEMLTKKPSDLTRIYRGAGEFPYRRVYKIIESGGKIIGHGGKMPVWGEAFGGERAIKINELIHYLESIQAGY